MPISAVALQVRANTITYFARQNLLEHGWRHALKLILEEVPGLSTDQAIEMFKGEKCFVDDTKAGPGNILFVDDPDSADWVEELTEKYGTTCKINRGHYRPYALVTDYGPNDFAPGTDDHPKYFVSQQKLAMFQDNPDWFDESNTRDFERRAKHYANQTSDQAVTCSVARDGRDRQLVVLFEESDEPPYWMEEKTAQQAVDAAAGEMLVVGFQDTYGSHNLSVERDLERMKHQAMLNLSDSGLAMSGTAATKLEEYLRSASEATNEHFETRRIKILQQNDVAGYGYRPVDFGVGMGVRNVPNGPLVKWALNRGIAMKDRGPVWEPVSMSGLKQAGDDPVHTDWITGAGLEAHDFSMEPLKTIQNALAKAIQQEVLGFTMHVLVAGKPSASGIVKHCNRHSEVDRGTIAVVPNASIHFERIAREAAAVIVQNGGELSHLAVNGLDQGYLVIRDEDAKMNYPEGTVVTIDVNAGKVFKHAPQSEPAEDDALGLKHF